MADIKERKRGALRMRSIKIQKVSTSRATVEVVEQNITTRGIKNKCALKKYENCFFSKPCYHFLGGVALRMINQGRSRQKERWK